VRQVLIATLSGERFWAFVLGALFVVGFALLPLVLWNILAAGPAFAIAWLIGIASAFAAHAYRGRAMMWEALCRKARRESSEFMEGLLRGRPEVIEVMVQPNDPERMPN
jgi:hypothetical protein